ncbi:MAG TPA: NADH-quinone oxidoreductase subunit C [Armatimonadota bacterium]|jgi:NADH/F420H2 dehydrogenase subunit C
MEQTTQALDAAAERADVLGQDEPRAFTDRLASIVASLEREFPGAVMEHGVGLDMPAMRLRLEDWVACCRWLRDEPGLRYALLSDLTAVDYLERSPRFDLVAHLYSHESQTYLRVKTGVEGAAPEAPTLCEVWPGANWLEREVWDMFGIRFVGHPDLRRILTPDGWEYFALRRDFPLQGPGMIKLYDSVKDVF